MIIPQQWQCSIVIRWYLDIATSWHSQQKQSNSTCMQLGQASTQHLLGYELKMNPPPTQKTVQHCNENVTIHALISVKIKFTNAFNKGKHQRHVVMILKWNPHIDSVALKFFVMRICTKGSYLLTPNHPKQRQWSIATWHVQWQNEQWAMQTDELAEQAGVASPNVPCLWWFHLCVSKWRIPAFWKRPCSQNSASLEKMNMCSMHANAQV